MKVRTKHNIHDHVLDDRDHQDLTPDKVYTPISLEYECYRIVDDRVDPVLYPNYLFTVEDSTIPGAWIRCALADGEYFWGPPEFQEPGFWCKYHDGNPAAVQVFREWFAREKAAGFFD